MFQFPSSNHNILLPIFLIFTTLHQNYRLHISRIGNNINQISAVVNETYTVTPYQMKILQNQMAEIQRIVKNTTEKKFKVTKFKEKENWAGDIDGDYKNHKNKG